MSYGVFSVVINEDEDSRETNVCSNNEVSDKHKARDERLVVASRRLKHAVRISRIKPLK